MKKAWTLAVTAFLITVAALLASPEGPAPAQDVVARAGSKAEQAGKNVFLVYHASWCGWCRRLESFLSSPEVKPILVRHYELAFLTVQERGEKKKLDNPGGNEMLERLSGGRAVGLPFYAVLDPKANPLATSLVEVGNARSENLGYPGTAEEIQAFVNLVRKTARGVTPEELETLRRNLEARLPKKS